MELNERNKLEAAIRRLRAGIVLALLGITAVGWLYLSGPTLRVSGIQSPLSCAPVGWTWLSSRAMSSPQPDPEHQLVKEYAEAKKMTFGEAAAEYHRGCDLARQDRQTQITVVSVVWAMLFLIFTRRRVPYASSHSDTPLPVDKESSPE